MRPIQQTLALILVVGSVAAVAPSVRADTGVQLGVRGGVQLLDNDELRHGSAPSVGPEARFGFALSPLVVALSFDHFFVEDRTLYQIGANALYDLPIAHSFLYPYAGVGLGLTGFAVPEGADGPLMMGQGVQETSDSNGTRFGLNLVGGMRFDHVDVPLVRPFAQVTATVGPIDLVTVTGGVLFELDGR
jgi:opacity protein-like surface antigen